MPLPLLLGLGVGALQGGLGVAQGVASGKAAQQDYLNQTAFQNANNQFAQWQAGFNARVNDTNNQYQYWAQTINYNQDLAYTKSMRNVELMKSIQQAEVVRDTRAAAGASYVQDSNSITRAYGEASMQEAVALQQYKWRALQSSAAVQAMAAEGQSVDRIVNDYARQQGDYTALQQVNQGIRNRQYTNEQAAMVSQYLSRWQSQAFYNETTYFDPIPPFAPLPTLITPSGPTMTGAPPSNTATMLNIGTGILGGISAGISTYQGIKGLMAPGGK